MNPKTFLLPALLFLAPSCVNAGPLVYGICQSGCAAIVMACYAAGGATWGATAGATAGPTIIACNTAFGACSAKCAAIALLAPVPWGYHTYQKVQVNMWLSGVCSRMVLVCSSCFVLSYGWFCVKAKGVFLVAENDILRHNCNASPTHVRLGNNICAYGHV